MRTNILYLGDCIEIMEQCIEHESVALIYADPPYNLSGKSLNLVNNQTGGSFYKMNEDWDVWRRVGILAIHRAVDCVCY
jgi:site-specific DNA-methyltransferase (adenine-specific)